ncbi:MAG: selenium cofactor biosynthesis protein YqeC, partial [Candidatus Adiutrix sp.]
REIMFLSEMLDDCQNVALIGGGGKTFLMGKLEEEFYKSDRPALLSLTTRLGREQLGHLNKVEAANIEVAKNAVRLVSCGERLVLAGPNRGDGDEKLNGLPLDWLPSLRNYAPPNMAFVFEADGAKGRPLKAHSSYEPVLPPLKKTKVVAVLGLEVLIKPLIEAVHRPQIFRQIMGNFADEAVLTAGQIAKFINLTWRRFAPDIILLNQLGRLGTAELIDKAHHLAELISGPNHLTAIGDFGEYYRL